MMIRGDMKNWFLLVALAFVLIAAGALPGIKMATAASMPIKLRMMVPSEPARMSSVYGVGGAMMELILYNVMEPLVEYTKDGPVPRLATKWEQEDLTTWRLYLRRGVKFHNGDDFTARDVVEYAKWLIEVKKESRLYPRLPLKKAVAIDDYTVDLIFEKPQPLFLINAHYFLIPPTAISRDNREMSKTQVIGTGPYRFVEWKKGQHIKLNKFEDYWGSKPQIDDVEITFRAEESVRVAALLAREADWVYGLSPEQASRVPKVARMPSPETVWLRFDESVQKEFTGKNPIFTDKRLRLAVEYAIDRQALVALYKGFATPSLGQFASPGDFGFNPDLKNRSYDLEKAKALVREAGAVGKSVTFVGSSDRWSKGRETAEAIAYMIEQTGLKVKLMLLTHAESMKYFRVLGEERKFISDLYINAADAFLEVESRYRPQFTEGGPHYALSDLEPTRLYKEVLAEPEYAKRGEKLGKAWAYVYEQAHYIPLFKLEWIWGMAQNLEWRIDIAGRAFISDMRFTN